MTNAIIDADTFAVRLIHTTHGTRLRGIDPEGRHHVARWLRRAEVPTNRTLTRDDVAKLCELIDTDTRALFDTNCRNKYAFGDKRIIPWRNWSHAREALVSDLNYHATNNVAGTRDYVMPCRPETIA